MFAVGCPVWEEHLAVCQFFFLVLCHLGEGAPSHPIYGDRMGLDRTGRDMLPEILHLG